MQYLLDANTFIQAKNQYYAMDICPGYWDWLEQENGLGRVGSISEIARELKRQDDELSCWVKERDKPDFFLPVDDRQTQEVYAQIANYVVQHFEEKHFAPFLGVADPWLVAKAKENGSGFGYSRSIGACKQQEGKNSEHLSALFCAVYQYFFSA